MSQPLKRYFKMNIDRIFLLLLITIKVGSGIVWLAQDNSSVDTRDEMVLLVRTAGLLNFLKEQGVDDISLNTVLRMSMAGRPILYQILMLPFLEIFGISLDSATYVNLLFDILLIIAAYNIGMLSAGRQVGLLTAVLVATYPSLLRIEYILRANYAVVGCAALSLWLWMRFYKTRFVKDVWFLNLSLSLGFLIHPTFLWGVPIPLALYQVLWLLFGSEPRWMGRPREVWAWLWSKLRQPVFLYGILPSAVVSIGLILMWYIPFASAMLRETEAVANTF